MRRVCGGGVLRVCEGVGVVRRVCGGGVLRVCEGVGFGY